ncbi:MAG: hypothetical protein M3433_01690 [Actinomycetota bacterium]|nr:hypothetical protein [Actinomycetota bacterium]
MSARAVLLFLAGLVVLVLLPVFVLMLSGEDMGELWGELVLPLTVLAVCFGLLWLGLGLSAAVRIRNRRRRALGRYQLVLSQADEATFEEVAAAYEQLVQTVRESLTERFVDGQPWFALESWFLPAGQAGETGIAALMLLCEPHTREHAMASLRRAFPDVSLRPDPAAGDGSPLEFVQPSFAPDHVLRVRKTRSWALPVGSVGRQNEGSNARSTMAGVIRQQQQAGRLSCVRWCVMPAADQLDSRAAEKLEGFAGRGPNAAHSADVSQALQSAGGAMSFLELQAAVEQRQVAGRGGRERPESFSELQNVCRQLLSPALSQRGANHLTERLMVFRQGLYRRRWARAEPPLLPDPSGKTLVSPRELALLMELPSLGSEHALPLQRNTVPHLPIPTEVPRTRQPALELPLDATEQEAETEEIVDAELVFDREPSA